jgi:hypothetical protein
MSIRPIALSALVLALAAPAEGAQITVTSADGLNMITIEGSIVSGDAEQFRNAVLRVSSPQNTVVILKSPGGLLFDALQIGELIHTDGLSTLVPDGVVCASACADIWLAGSKRLISPDGRVGFHAAYDENGNENGRGNAIVGAYLTRLGLGYSAVSFMTEAAPDDMAWLTKERADELGIAYDVVDFKEAKSKEPVPFISRRQAAVAPPAALPQRSPASVSLQQDVETWLARYFAAGDAPNAAQKPNAVISWYYVAHHESGGMTMSFKKLLSATDLIAEKLKFVTRWPIRDYRVRPGTVSVVPRAEAGWLDVAGIVDWTCSAPDRGQATSVGSERFSFELFNEGGGFFSIAAEDAEVLTRTLSGGVQAERR